MEILGVDELMRYLKGRYDTSDRKKEWRALSGRNHVRGSTDTFVLTDDSVYQIMSKDVSKDKTLAVGREVGSCSPDLAELARRGSPIPIGLVSRAPDASAIVMFGMQQYSSDTADILRGEYFGSKQEALRADLDSKLERLVERPEFRKSYRSLRDDQDGYFA